MGFRHLRDGKMNLLKTIFSFFLFLLLSANGSAQDEPYAEILNATHTDFCVAPGDPIVYELTVRFHGEAPFGLRYKTPSGNPFANEPLYPDNGIWEREVTFSFEVSAGETDTTGTIELVEVFDNNYGDFSGGVWQSGTGVEINDQSVTFSNWAIPEPEAGSAIDSCGLQAVLNASPDEISNNYHWESPTTGTITDVTNPNATYETPSIGDYTLTFTQENGACIVSDDINITLRGAPTATISTSSNVCGTSTQEATLDLEFTGDGPWDYKISDGSSNEITNNTTSASTTENTNVNGETVFSFEWVLDNNGCYARAESIADEATIVDLMPETNAGEDFVVCGLEANLDATADKGTGLWTWEGENLNLADPENPKSAITASEQGIYTLTWTENNNGCENSDELQLRFVEIPSASFGTTQTHICEGNNASFPVEISGENGPWNLTYEIDGGEPDNYNFENASSTLLLTPEVSTLYKNIAITNQFGCTSNLDDQLTVNVDQMPDPDAGNDNSVCGHEITLDATRSPAASEAFWTSDEGIFEDETDPKTLYSSTDLGEPDYGEKILTWHEENGLCTATDEVAIRFDREPQADAGEDITLYHQYKTTLHAYNPEVGSGNWHISSGSGTISETDSPNAEIEALQHGETTLEWTVTNGVCPPVSDFMVITVNDLTYHTGISPNNDGQNDYFKIKGAHTIPNNELIIFDQNGQVVFRKKNLEEDNEWGGTEMDGSPVDNGIYYFIFKGEGIEPVKDYLVIKRN